MPTSARPTHSLQCVIARAQSARGNPSPVPSAPCPKGLARRSRDWGILSPHPLQPIRRGGVLPRPRKGQSPSPTHFLQPIRRGDPCGRPSIAPRQGTRALPYKVLRYRARADRVVRPYKHFRRGGPPISRRTPKPPHYFSPPLVLPRRMCYNFLIKVEF